MTQSTFETADDRHGEIDQVTGNAGTIHHLPGHDEQNHGHQRKNIQLTEYSLGQHRQVTGVVAGNKSQHGRSSHDIRQRCTGKQKQDCRDEDQPDQ